jgi:hypothetical protein
MEPRQSTVPQRLLIINAHQLHKHVRYQYSEVLDVARLVQEWHDPSIWILGPRSFGWRRGDLQHSTLFLWHSVLLYDRSRALLRHPSTLRLRILGRHGWLRIHPQSGLWGLRGDGCGGSFLLLDVCDGERGQWGGCYHIPAAGVAAGGRGALSGRRVIGGGQTRRGVLGADVDVAPLTALRLCGEGH